jgi:DNA-binding MarR family transcriptional regulator
MPAPPPGRKRVDRSDLNDLLGFHHFSEGSLGGMGSALGTLMDAVMFEMKAAHLAVQRVGRRLLRPHGLTVARFDLMNALGEKGMRQSDLWKRLNVVRSVICEMVRSLMELGWVERVRAKDTRTWLVMLTRQGRAIFRRAFDQHVESGDVAVLMDYGITRKNGEADALDIRETLWWHFTSMHTTFRASPWWRGPDLYLCDPEDYYFWLTEPGGLADEVPFVS